MITIRKSPTADSRTCDVTRVTKEQLYASSEEHIEDVRAALMFFQQLLGRVAMQHDFDKLSDIDGFYSNFRHKFAEGHTDWWERHRRLNRHHLDQADGVRDDVNLLDVLDYIADCTMAGMARSGSVRPLTISDEVLRKAFDNTCALLLDNVRLAVDPAEREPLQDITGCDV